MENMQRLHAEKGLLSRELELLMETEDGMLLMERANLEMKRNMDEMIRQKKDAEMIIKKYKEKHGSIDSSTESASTPPN
jgi:hypothetical protein